MGTSHLPRITSTFLVPESLLSELGIILKDYDSMEQYIAFLLGRFFPDENSVDFPACHDRVTTSYQEDELNLRRLNFRIAPELWAYLEDAGSCCGSVYLPSFYCTS